MSVLVFSHLFLALVILVLLYERRRNKKKRQIENIIITYEQILRKGNLSKETKEIFQKRITEWKAILKQNHEL